MQLHNHVGQALEILVIVDALQATTVLVVDYQIRVYT